MSTLTPVGYCPNCRQNVLVKREEIHIGLAILLFLLTFIGFFIYLILYYRKPEDRCIHCGTQCLNVLDKSSTVVASQNHLEMGSLNQEVISEKAAYCPLCGSELDQRNPKFCPNCGSDLRDS